VKKYAHDFLSFGKTRFFTKGSLFWLLGTGILCHVREHEEHNAYVTVRPGGVVAMCYQRYVRRLLGEVFDGKRLRSLYF
jgi:hypothetical protein